MRVQVAVKVVGDPEEDKEDYDTQVGYYDHVVNSSETSPREGPHQAS